MNAAALVTPAATAPKSEVETLAAARAERFERAKAAWKEITGEDVSHLRSSPPGEDELAVTRQIAETTAQMLFHEHDLLTRNPDIALALSGIDARERSREKAALYEQLIAWRKRYANGRR